VSHLAAWHRNGGRKPVDELELHLMRCRRREESAWVLVARVAGRARVPDLLARLRVTDSVRTQFNVHGKELACVVDAAGLDRSALERRLRAGLPNADVRFGWSHFPKDGAALDVLLHKARAGLARPHAVVTPAAAVPSLEVEGK
jgi:hypothetical protein